MKEFIEKSGLTAAKFAKKYDIPYNTVRQWAAQIRKAPEWLVKLFESEQNYKPLFEEYKEVKKENKAFPRVNYLIQWKPRGEYRIVTYGYTTLEEVKKVTATLTKQEYRILIVDYEREIEI